MKIRLPKTLSLVMGSLACISLPLSAATDPAKPKSTTPAATPMIQDSLGRAQTLPATGTDARAGTIDQTTGNATGMPAGVSASQVSPMDTARFSDARIFSILNTVDQHEIDAAEKTLKKKPSPAVRDYAQMLKKEHSANMAKSKKLAKSLDLKPAKSDIADSLKAKGEAEAKTLAALKGAEYEKAYIDAMVTGHTAVLDMLDTQLIPNARNDSLKSHLTEARGHVASHLELGKRLQGAQASTPAE